MGFTRSETLVGGVAGRNLDAGAGEHRGDLGLAGHIAGHEGLAARNR